MADAARAGTLTLGGDLDVHRLGYGAMRLTGEGIWGPPADRANALAVLRRAVELGVTFIDTADAYGPHVNEELIAEALRGPGGYPHGLVVATKGGFERSGPGRWRPNGDPAHLRAACEGSLRRLGVERIDLYQLHVPDADVPYAESVGALAELQREGKIRHVGVSNVDDLRLEEALAQVEVVAVQNRYSVVDRGSEGVLRTCTRKGIAFIPWFPLGAGGLPGPGPLTAIAAAREATPFQVALAWLLQRSPVMIPIPGTASLTHLEEDVWAAALRLDEEDVRALDALG